MDYGERELKRGCKGPDVAELQLRLAGFRGTVPDGDFGPGTERQVMNFRRDFMGEVRPSGVVDRDALRAIDRFAREFPINFSKLKCRCGSCDGFGQGRFRGKFAPGKPRIEAFYQYEYPGMHRMLLWAVRAAFFYHPEHEFVITSGYRCETDNRQHRRSSTNHRGKAIDIDVPLKRGEDKRDDMAKCDAIRGKIVETANAQIGWTASNLKSLEPSNIAPTWVHYDVRSYQSKYLKDAMFCTTLKELDNRKPIRF